MIKATLFSCIVSFMLLLPGCGGGTGNAVPLQTNNAIVLSATLKPERTAVPIKAIAVSFSLPGAASPIRNQDGSLVIGPTGLHNLKSANGQIPQDSVNYDPASGTVKFTILVTDIINGDLGTGDIARLTYETSSGTQLSVQDISNLVYKVSGPGSLVLSDDIVPSVSIVTYQKP